MRVLLSLGLILIAAGTPAFGEEGSPAAPRRVDATLRHQGRTRSYRLHLPPQSDRAGPVPLVLALHGGGGTAVSLDAATCGQLTREAARRGWALVLPQGVAKGWNDGRVLRSWRDRRRAGVDDVAFLSALIDHLHEKHGIDRSRVYATGISNGGFMSFRLGLELSDKIAAIAPVTANLATVHDGKKPAHPVGLLVVNGTADPLVPYDGGEVRVLGQRRGRIHATDESMRRWAAFTGCSGEARTQAMPDRSPGDGTRAFRTVWPGGTESAHVQRIRIEGGGHTWPGGTQYLPVRVVGRVCRDFDAARVIFDFFAKHRRASLAPVPAK